MALNPVTAASPPRNAGPSWGYAFLRRADRWLPAPLFNFFLAIGTWVAVARMPAERANSGRYLRALWGRAATRGEVWKHFHAFARVFILRLRVAEGRPHRCRQTPGCEGFMALMKSGRPALLGTFHLGNSDLLGFFLKAFRREIFMIRLRMGNSADVEHLAERFAPWVNFIWVNETESLLFALKQAAQSGGSIALKCDRPEHSAKLEAFDFLGERRMFPVTIYHLALMFKRPVVFCVSVPGAEDESLIYASPVFEPEDDTKAANLERAHAHFQEFLVRVEALLRLHPFLWFNFTPLNPTASPSTPASPVPPRSALLPC